MVENLDIAIARADLARFRAACYYQPALEFVEEKVFDSIADAATLIDAALVAHALRLGQEFASEGREFACRLHAAFSRTDAAHRESFWSSGEHALMQESTIAVLDLYRDGGFELAEDFCELPDHILRSWSFFICSSFGRTRRAQG